MLDFAKDTESAFLWIRPVIHISPLRTITSYTLIMSSKKIELDNKWKGKIILNNLRLRFLSESINLANPMLHFADFFL